MSATLYTKAAADAAFLAKDPAAVASAVAGTPAAKKGLLPTRFPAINKLAAATPQVSPVRPLIRGGAASVSSGLTKSYTVTLADDSPVYVYGSAKQSLTSAGVGSAGNSPNIIFEFLTDAPSIDVEHTGGGSGDFVMLVNDRLVVPGFGTQGWQNAFDRIRFPDRKMRKITIYAGNSQRIKAIWVDQASTVVRPVTKERIKIGMVMDSFGGGVSSYTLPFMVARMLGGDLFLTQYGGSGFNTDGGDPAVAGTSFVSRTADLTRYDLDLLLNFGGINGALNTLAQGVTDTLTAQRADHPTTPIINIGPWSPSATYEAANVAKWTTIKAATEAFPGAFYVDTRGWVTGTGKSDAPANDGNADVVTNTDGTHPTQTGKEYLAMKSALAILQIVNAQLANQPTYYQGA